MEAHHVEARDGARLFYRVQRARPDGGRALVLLHGFASNGTRWSEFAARSEALRRWTLITPDLRGHGRSPWRGRLTSEHWVADIVTILAAEGYARAVVGGHCLGANTALRFAHAHPGRTTGLALIEPMLPAALGGSLGRLRRLRGLLPALAAPVRGLNALGVQRGDLPVLDLAKLDRQSRAALAESGDPAALTRRHGAIRHDLRYMAVAAYLQALAEVVRPLPPLAGIEAPALVLLSAGGLFGDPDMTRAHFDRLPDARSETLDAQHWIPTEQPEAMATLLDRWLLALAGSD